MIDINTFISTNVTQRGNSMFAPDLDANEEQIRENEATHSYLSAFRCHGLRCDGYAY